MASHQLRHQQLAVANVLKKVPDSALLSLDQFQQDVVVAAA